MSATLFGQPRGLATLFLTEMWERFTFYGMRALLVLFLVSQVTAGGFGLDYKTATAIYGLYNAAVYLAALPGGWIADRLIGAQEAIRHLTHRSIAADCDDHVKAGLQQFTCDAGGVSGGFGETLGQIAEA